MKRGEVWWAQLEPVVGDEMGKVRLVVVVNPDEVGRLALRVAVPLTGWQDHFAKNGWMARLDPTPENGLKKASAADTFQVRALSTDRFRSRVGTLSDEELEEVTDALSFTIGK